MLDVLFTPILLLFADIPEGAAAAVAAVAAAATVVVLVAADSVTLR
jgi:hypothetical protein